MKVGAVPLPFLFLPPEGDVADPLESAVSEVITTLGYELVKPGQAEPAPLPG